MYQLGKARCESLYFGLRQGNSHVARTLSERPFFLSPVSWRMTVWGELAVWGKISHKRRFLFCSLLSGAGGIFSRARDDGEKGKDNGKDIGMATNSAKIFPRRRRGTTAALRRKFWERERKKSIKREIFWGKHHKKEQKGGGLFSGEVIR